MQRIAGSRGLAVRCAALGAVAAGWLAAGSPPARADSVEGEWGPAAAPQAAGPAEAAAFRASVHRVRRATLPRFDPARLLAEDAQRAEQPGPRARRIGAVRTMGAVRAPQRLRPGRRGVTVIEGGDRIWTLEVESPGAFGLRLRLTGCDLPPGAEVVCYAADDPSQAFGPWAGTGPRGDGEVWTPTLHTERVRLELRVPASQSAERVGLAVRAVAHGYAPAAAGEDEFGPKAAGNCHASVQCNGLYASTISHAVARMEFISDGYTYHCSGCLLADNDSSTVTPWFLTAYHCVSTQAEASTIDFYWDYFATSCVGSVPSLSSVPRSSGADLVVASGDTDVTLLRATSPVPSGRYYAGWSSNAPSTGIAVACVHHPDGTEMRICTGTLVGLYPSYANVRWSNGVTEGGSSGSPLFDPSQKVIGQLWGGVSSCSNPSGLDYYGRFDVSYPWLEPYLSASTPAPIPPPPPPPPPGPPGPPVAPPPPPPVGLAATVDADGRVVLTWRTEVVLSAAVEVFRAEGVGVTEPEAVVSGDGRTYTDTDVHTGWTYAYRIRTLSVNGPSTLTNPASATAPASFQLGLGAGSVADSEKPRKDKASIAGTFEFESQSAAAGVDPVASGVSIQLGDREPLVRIEIPPGDAGWRSRKSKFTWKSPKGAAAKATLSVDAAKGTFKLSVSAFDLGAAPTPSMRALLAFGPHGGAASSTWDEKRPGVLILK